MPISEVGLLPVQTPPDYTDPSSEFYQATKIMWKAISSAPGFISGRFGPAIETPTNVHLYIEWKDVESHAAFGTSPAYADLRPTFAKVLAGRPSYYHVNFDSDADRQKAIEAPFTENGYLYVPADGDHAAFLANIKAFKEAIAPHAKGSQGFAYGWAIEDVEHESLGEGKKGKLLVILAGWDSLESHAAFRESDAFKQNVGKLREGRAGFDVFHTQIRGPLD